MAPEVFANGFLYGAGADEALRALAQRHAPEAALSNEEIRARAEAEFPDFPALVKAMCR